MNGTTDRLGRMAGEARRSGVGGETDRGVAPRLSRRSAGRVLATTAAALPSLAAAMAGGAPGGSGSGGAAGPATAMTKEAVSLRLQQITGQSEEYAQRYAQEFSQKYPNVKIEVEEYPSGDYWTKILALHASDQ